MPLLALAAPSAATADGRIGPPRAKQRDCDGAPTHIRAANNTRYIDCAGVSLPDNASTSLSWAVGCP